MSDISILGEIGNFIRSHRLESDKTQNQLAAEAGISRSALVDIEQGKRSNLLTLIQILRAQGQLQVLENFRVTSKVSPLLLARMEKETRKRASGKDRSFHTESDW